MKVKKLNSHIEMIVAGYKKQYEFYDQLLQLSKQMEGLLMESDMERVAQLLASREDVINGIKLVDEEMAEHKKEIMDILHLKKFDLSGVKDLIFPQLLKELKAQRVLIEETIKAILELDTKNEDIFQGKVKAMAGELKGIQQHFQIQKVYLDRPEDFPEPRFFDKKK